VGGDGGKPVDIVVFAAVRNTVDYRRFERRNRK
jgi:hypothetical protein